MEEFLVRRGGVRGGEVAVWKPNRSEAKGGRKGRESARGRGEKMCLDVPGYFWVTLSGLLVVSGLLTAILVVWIAASNPTSSG